MKHSDRLYETDLGYIDPEIKKVKLSSNTEKILSGSCDNEPLDPEKQPVLARINQKIKKKNYLRSELGLKNKDIADFFDMSEMAFANSSAKDRYITALSKFYTYLKERREKI